MPFLPYPFLCNGEMFFNVLFIMSKRQEFLKTVFHEALIPLDGEKERDREREGGREEEKEGGKKRDSVIKQLHKMLIMAVLWQDFANLYYDLCIVFTSPRLTSS
jgi:hypothetical protein